MKSSNLCPLCKGDIKFEIMAKGEDVQSVTATCTACGGTGSAPVGGVRSEQLGQRASKTTLVAMIGAHIAATRNIQKR